MRRILVTGGAGYIGSHVVAALLERGDRVVVLDNLSLGHREAVLPGAELIEADLSDFLVVDAVLADGPWHAVMHFAALSLVGDSVAMPVRYLAENAGNGFRLIDACIRHGVRRFVLSSTANLFGLDAPAPIREDAPIRPSSPYGQSKWMIEQALQLAAGAHGLASVCLRYFNAAGADPAGRLGEDHRPETHLIPRAIDAALGLAPPLTVFGADYPTPDGTCIRDYIHVSDLADAHLLALDRLEAGSIAYNLGSGRGYSVREVLRAVQAVTGRPVPTHEGERRAGDPAVLIAASERIRRETGWRPRHSDLSVMVETAYAWRLAHPRGYEAQAEDARNRIER